MGYTDEVPAYKAGAHCCAPFVLPMAEKNSEGRKNGKVDVAFDKCSLT